MILFKRLFETVFLVLIGSLTVFNAEAEVYDVTDFGAKGDGITLNSKSIQQAIDESAAHGGGTVYFPAGSYVSGTIFLKDNIHLYLGAGATLIGSTDVAQFPQQISKRVSLRTRNYSLIYAEDKTNLAISGEGTITGQGEKAPYHIFHKDREAPIVRPNVICLIGCRHVQVKDLTLKNSPNWMQHYQSCDDLLIDGITVSNRWSSVNNDGLDIDGCRNVRIANCNIDAEDDAIVLKSTSGDLCENVTITGCVLTSHCNALKCGTESSGGFRNIAITGCVIYDTYLSGIALEIVDGGIMDLVNINNITMNRVNNPLFIKLGNRARPYSKDLPKPGIGKMQNIHISNIQATEVGEFLEDPEMKFSHYNARAKAAGIFIDGLPEQYIDQLSLDGFFISYKGGCPPEDAGTQVPILPESYPEYSAYGDIHPSYGLYGRFVSHLSLKNIRLVFEKSDFRPAFQFEHVNQLTIENPEGEKATAKQAVLKLVQCKNIFISRNPISLKIKDIQSGQCENLVIH